MEKRELNKYSKEIVKFLSNKKVQNIILIILLLGVLVFGTWMRVQNLPLLKDSTTEEYIPLALDPFYFLRVAETIVDNGGTLPEFDNMRSPGFEVPWHHEILPKTVVLTQKIVKIFNPGFDLRLADVLNPVIFFVLGIVAFFLLVFLLTKNKWLALLSALLLTVSPAYLYRTLAGFSDHESIGMFAFFLAFLVFSIGVLKFKKDLFKGALMGAASGFATALSILSWTGIAKFLFMIFPLTFLIIWLLNKNKKREINEILFYGFWIIFTFIGCALLNYSFKNTLGLMLSSTGILTLFTLLFIIIDFILPKYVRKVSKYSRRKRILASLIGTIVIGTIFYQILFGSIFDLISKVFSTLLHPFGESRLGLTVAENRQPYLTEWISQTGKFVFWTFFIGCLLVGERISRGIKIKKIRRIFLFSWAIFISGILFSRISEGALLNGSNFISKFIFFVPAIIFMVVCLWTYLKSDLSISSKWIIIASWMIPMLIAVRGATRLFFSIVPFVSFISIWFIFETYKMAKKPSKDELRKVITYIVTIALIILLFFTLLQFTKTTISQAKSQSPSASDQWQKSMKWVRENTPQGSLFAHWWDYGYWVQTLGERPTIADGGQVQAIHNGNYNLARYVLTTPRPETAKSYFKTMNISYFLIDPTDVGKYSAYSSIGSDDTGIDRYSWLITMISDPNQIQETKDSIIRVYQGGIPLDEDVYYNENGTEIFLPRQKAAIGGVVLEITGEGFNQPTGVYIYNGQQHSIPLRYLYANGKLIDFGNGVNSTFYVYSRLYQSSQGLSVDQNGAGIYLSEKTKDSFLAKIYLMNDPENEYPELELAHSQGYYDFNFYYNGFQGPIRIYEIHTDEMTNINNVEDFKLPLGETPYLDNATFINF